MPPEACGNCGAGGRAGPAFSKTGSFFFEIQGFLHSIIPKGLIFAPLKLFHHLKLPKCWTKKI
jgi:hypothetical protein